MIIPPSTVIWLSGISNFDGAEPIFIAIWMTTGIITATKGVLFMKAEAMAMKPNSTTIVVLGRSPTWRSASPITISTAPVRTNPPITMNISAMVQGAEFDSTDTASLIGNSPRTSIAAAPAIATTSIGNVSRTNMTNITAKTASATSGCMSGLSSSPIIAVLRDQILSLLASRRGQGNKILPNQSCLDPGPGRRFGPHQGYTANHHRRRCKDPRAETLAQKQHRHHHSGRRHDIGGLTGKNRTRF